VNEAIGKRSENKMGTLGVLATGIFVGVVLSQLLFNLKPNVKSALTLLGAALGGVPIAFLGDASSTWAYPVGLLIGLFYIRIYSARSALVNPSDSMTSFFAWIDLIVIAAVALLAFVYAGFVEFVR
jgi:hypothetical protein